MKYILETTRLKLRELDLIDAKDFYDLNSNPNVIKYTGDSAFNSIEDANQFLENYQDYELNGYGRWTVILKETNQFIGWCGLKLNNHETDIGFRFFEEEWNKGYATESAIACLNYGFEELKLRSIIGRTMKNNVRSIRVLEKIGLQYERDIEFDGCDGVVYKIEK
ncbi:GNAT family N-acetyltransferase [Dysgonomonas capnocytophagoides]|uniref:GNAT family N-acetyltransferase n=1 Tax=Dysgonomonas capnocytophagoides TaxID=45254 RepID=UPI00334112AF